MKSTTLISQDSKLKAALLQRGEDASAVGLRDLNRYYALLHYHLLELSLTTSEAKLICEALEAYRFEADSEQARTIWKQINEAIRQDELNQTWSVKRETLSRKLQGLSHLQAMALVDAAEQYWLREQYHPDESLETRLSQVALIKCCDFAL